MKAVFLDRDGVISELVISSGGMPDSPLTVEQFRLLPRVGNAIRRLNENGYLVVVASNQPAVAKGYLTPEALRGMDEKLRSELMAIGAHVDGIYYCLHHPEGKVPYYRAVCECRKPEPGLLEQAARDCGIRLNESVMVGDNLTDVQAGKRAGCKTILIGRMKCELCHLMEERDAKPDAIAANLAEAVTMILSWSVKNENIC